MPVNGIISVTPCLSLSSLAATRRLPTEGRGALRRDSPKWKTSCGVSVEEAGRDPLKKVLRGVRVDDGGGRGVAVDDCGGGGSRPSNIITREETNTSKTPRIGQLAACWLLLPC